MFVGREEELKFLEQKYANQGCDLILLYGRRRIGKTSLIRKFAMDKKCIYLMATQEDHRQIIKNFSYTCAEFFKDELIMSNPFSDSNAFFKYLLQKLASSKEKIVLVFDELTYLIEQDSSFLSVFQKYYDSNFQELNILIILTGSLINIVRNDVLNYNSPIYGRKTGNIELGEMDFSDLKLFFKKIDAKDAMIVYSIYGGIPYYLELLDDGLKPIEKFLEPHNIYINEPLFILGQELRSPDKYFTILRFISAGKNTSAELADSMNLNTNELSPYLEKLKLMGIISRITPVFSKSNRIGIFEIASNYFNFYFRFIFPNIRALEIGNRNSLINLVNNDINQYVSKIFERVCLSYMAKHSVDLFNQELVELGRWWGRDKNKQKGMDIVEIDIVGKFEDGSMIFGEVKWTDNVVNLSTLLDLKNKSDLFSSEHQGFILFSKSGFSKELIDYCRVYSKNHFLMDINDIYR